ncbi:MAG TPA: aspartate aminotransferase family protein [Stellaceae bacterium]|nr:aspartate aminotransferase family protein [Stellaceae bacterium]
MPAAGAALPPGDAAFAGVAMTLTHAANIDLDAALAEAEELYRARNPKSLAQHQAACAAMPGGNTRASIHTDPFPLAMAKGKGAHLWDLDGHEYADFLSEFTAGIYGHSHPAIRRAIEAALAGGLNFGAQSEAEARFAAAVCARFPSIELVRFTNSGTEANLMAVSAARAITGRPKILVFGGGYHGGVFYFRGHGSRLNAPFDYLLGRYNDLAAVAELVRPHRADLAAILVEPMQGTTGCIPAEREFLAGLRELASETGALLIFDEVMTSRLAPGGLQEVHGILPDLTTLGKYLGGGMSFGAFGGRGDIMARFDPRRGDAFQHAGTFNNNVLTMNAGYVGLTEIYTPDRARALNRWGDGLRERLGAVARRHGLPMQFTGLGSMMSVHMTRQPIRSEADAAQGDGRLRDLFWFDLVARGLWFAKRGMFALSIALDDGDADRLADAVEEFAQTRTGLFR